MTETTHVPTNAVIVTADNRDRLLAKEPVFFRLACNLAAKIKYGALVFVLPDGKALKFVGEEETGSVGVILVKDYAFARRTILRGDIGFFESFADDQWDSPSIADCLYIFARNADYVREAFLGSPLVAWIDYVKHLFNSNTKSGARRNIHYHYDLGNAFYEKWLDPTMTYSSARYPTPAADLSVAQTNKYRTLATAMELRPGERVLEIGSGWGGFAEFAARDIGAQITGVTISKEQFDYACQRIQREGLNERVRFELRDYRDVDGQFDKIASIEMFEAVGEKYWPTYFNKVRDALKPGGVAGLQIITIADRFFDTYRRSADFIQRFVFPGGMLPSPSVLKDQVERAGLVWRAASSFGADYARTLNEWHRRFLAAWEDIRPMGFDDRFKKLWRFYLGYCEAGFRAQTTDVCQVSAARA
ncbi:MAG: cyclopropane-fatty-acyl-phospholipid synthase family protein [Pseudomonadota bacterium]|nr:cyclopropane-fatty-acyl-phospholipid synthase family protein [Pseudomonadota bacterium]